MSQAMTQANYVWNAATPQPLAIHVARGVINNLSLKAMEAHKAVPRRGLEIGGVLLGRRETRDGFTTIQIEDFRPVDSEHRSGPSYRLSESDLARLDETVKQCGNSVLGVYRTQTRSESLQVQQHDLELFRRYFSAGNGLFLLAGPASGTAAFFLPQDGALVATREFPFHPEQLHPEQSNPAERSRSRTAGSTLQRQLSHKPLPHGRGSVTAPVLKGSAVIQSRTPSRNRKGAVLHVLKPNARTFLPLLRFLSTAYRFFDGHKFERAAVTAGLAALVFAGAASTLWRSYARPVQAASLPERVHMHVALEGRSVRLFWDRDSQMVRAAGYAILHIHDGARKTKLNLTPKDLNMGSMAYVPESPDVTFRLETHSANLGTSESIAMIALPVAFAPASIRFQPPEPVTQSQPSVSEPAATEPVITERPITERVITERALEPKTQRRHSKPRPADTPRKKNVDPAPPESSQAGLVPDPGPAAPEAPSVDESTEPSSTVPETQPVLSSEQSASPALISDPGPYVSIVAEPLPGTRLTRAVGEIPILRRLSRPSRSAFVPPTPKHQVRPILSSEDRLSLINPILLDVKVHVGESGKVIFAEVLSKGIDKSGKLATAAIYAAHQWDFEPARADDAAVPCEVILHFRFSPHETIAR